MKILTTVTASAGLDVASSGSDTIKLGSTNTENNDAVVDNLIVWANADFKNNVTLGSSVADNTLVNSKLTASNSLYVSGNLYVNGVDITASSGGSGGGSGLSAQDVSGALTIYAKSTDVSSSFVDNSELTSAITNFPTRTEVTGATNTVLTTVAATYATKTGVTGALSSYATLSGVSASFVRASDVSSSFVTNTQVTSALSSYATLTGVSGTFVSNTSATSSLARLAAANTFTSNQIISGTLNITSSITSSALSSSTIIYSPLAYIGLTSIVNNPTALLRVNGEIAAGSSATMTIKGDSNCVIIGSQAGRSNTNSIIAVGKNALSASTGGYNVAIGNDTLVTSSGARNVALGYAGLNGNTTGLGNIAVGYQPLFLNTIGNYNIGQGYWALYNNTTGEYNTAIGFQALYSNITGSYNLAIGQNAGGGLSTGSYNVFIGKYTGITTSEKSVYISDNFGNLKLSANSAGLVTIQNALAVNGTTVLGDAAADTTTTSGSLSVLNNIKFPATQVASADANTLDDYEEGTWTPAFEGTGWTYNASATNGRYTKIGNMVYIDCQITVTATGSSGLGIRVNNLPFTSNSSQTSMFAISRYANLAAGISSFPVGYISPSTNYASIQKEASATPISLQVTDLTNTSIIRFNGIYAVSS